MHATNTPRRGHGCEHPGPRASACSPAVVSRAAQFLRAMGDEARLRILGLLVQGECCVSEIVAASDEKFSTVSQRLRVLRTEGLVTRRRAGTHLYYALADRHVADLLHNALDHARELGGPGPAIPPGGKT
jgi:ArsR family transcriptional regulator, lead/cadmium/zinc/bismuth-responsive transcriptional repressor